MGVFKRTSKYRKLPTISEKEKFLNAELVKTGMLDENAPANSTSGVYFATATTGEPVEPSVQDVPDTSGVTAGASYTQAGGEGKPENGVWADPGYSDNSDLFNNDGGNADGKPILNSPWSGLADNSGNPSGSAGFGAYPSVWGTKFVTFNSDGTASQISDSDTSPYAEAFREYRDAFIAAGWPPNSWSNPGWHWRAYWVPFSIYNPRIDAYWPGSGSTPEWGGIVKGSPGNSPMALLGAYIWTGDQAKYNDPGSTGDKIVLQRAELGDPDFFPGDVQKNRKSEEEEAKEQLDVGDRAWDWLNDVSQDDVAFWNQPSGPPTKQKNSTTLQLHMLSDDDFEEKYGITKYDYLQLPLSSSDSDSGTYASVSGNEDPVEVTVVANEKAVIDGLGEMANQSGVSTQEFVDSALNYAEEDTSEEDTSDSENTSWFKEATVNQNVRLQIALSQLTNRPIEYNNDDIPQEQKETFIQNLTILPQDLIVSETNVNYADENIYRDENGDIQSNIGPNGEKAYYEENNTAEYLTDNRTSGNPLGSAGQHQLYVNLESGTIEYEDHAYLNTQSDNPDEISRFKFNVAGHEIPWDLTPELAGLVGGVSDLIHRFSFDKTAENHGAMANYPANETAEIRGDVSKSFSMPLAEAVKLNPSLANNPQVKEWLNKQQGTTQQQPAQQKVPEKKPLKAPDKPGYKKIITPNTFSDKSDGWIQGSLTSSLEHGELERVANEIGVDSSQLQRALEDANRLEAEWKSAEGADAQKAANKKLNRAVKYLGSLAKSGSGSVEYFKQDYKPEGNVLSEGWHSPEHVNVDKNERKRWFNPKDIAPEFPEKAPPKQVDGWHPDLKKKEDRQPCLLRQLMTRMSMKKGKLGMKEYIKVKEVDLLKNHRLKDKERKEFMRTINSINSYLTRNPSALIHAQKRYPKSDPHLAALNYKMDTMLAASKEFMDKKYPENTRLFNQLQKSVKRSIKLTDPTTFKVKLGNETSYKKLLSVNYVENIYDKLTKTETKFTKNLKNKKSASRFFRKEKPKTKSELIDLRLKQLEIDMQKTLTNP